MLKHDLRRSARLVALALFVGLSAAFVGAVEPSLAAAADDPLSGLTISSVEPNEVGLGDAVVFKVKGLKEAAAQNKGFSQSNLMLFLAGRPLAGHTPKPYIDGAMGCGPDRCLSFTLNRAADEEESKKVWDSLLGSPSSSTKTVSVAIGLASGDTIPFASGVNSTVTLKIYRPGWLYAAAIVFGFLLFLFVWLARSSNIVRDFGPKIVDPDKALPYSLGRVQMAWWFFVILGSYGFLFMITGEFDILTEQSLMLMGIAAGTALGSAMIDSGKNSKAVADHRALVAERDKLLTQMTDSQPEFQRLINNAARTPLEEERFKTLAAQMQEWTNRKAALDAQIGALAVKLEEPVSKGWFFDIISDKNGISFHRFQIFSWTIVLTIIFVIEVYQNLKMPEFSATLLALMGISSGTYLGFKFPEQKA